jgi:rod shape determining protein RodA
MLRQLDWVLALAVAALIGMGSLLVWSATKQRMLDGGLDPQTFFKKHLVNAVIGLFLAIGAALVDYRSLRAYAPLLYVLSILGLLAVLSPLGSTVNGAHSWIVLPAGFQIQPAEFAKVSVVVGLAMILAEKRDTEDRPRHSDVVRGLALTSLPMLLILAQPDLGTMLVLTFIVLGMLTVAAAPVRWVIGLLLAGAVVAVGAVQLGVLKDYQLDRFTAFTDPTHDTQGVGYNTNQARIAIGSGGLTGKGLFHGTQTSGRFIPEQQTDFVFTVAGEELGLAGGGALIGLLGVVMWRGLRIAKRSTDLFGRLVACGVVSWFAFQSFVNIGMTLGIMPVTGLPLPFVSYGGSSMFANLIAVGLLQNVHRGASATGP